MTKLDWINAWAAALITVDVYLIFLGLGFFWSFKV